MKITSILMVALTLAIVPRETALAQSNQVPPKVKAACTSDYGKFCATVIPGGGRVVACMKRNIDKVSVECRAALMEVKTAQ